ncbi:MAG: hypothetical protein ABI338_04475 [Gemmatimonadaceae bacterium]
MRVEDVPVIIGCFVAVVGVAIMWDAWGPQRIGPMRERRRRDRANIDAAGELVSGIGIVLLGVALIGRDWRFETPTVIAAAICLVVGALRNRKYFRETFMFRGANRRNPDKTSEKPQHFRIR